MHRASSGHLSRFYHRLRLTLLRMLIKQPRHFYSQNERRTFEQDVQAVKAGAKTGLNFLLPRP